MNVKIRNKFIEIKYSVSNGLVIFDLIEITLLIIKVSIKKDKFYFENSGGQDTQGGGEDTPGNFAPRGASCLRVSSPPGGKLPRGQDKPVHRIPGLVV